MSVAGARARDPVSFHGDWLVVAHEATFTLTNALVARIASPRQH